ncbi:MAG: asparagine synthase (glutamine-hydrolyzing) [Ilumatobacteraceae bacterium]
MCGISGVAGRQADWTNDVLAHRGPDGAALVRLDLGGVPAALHHSRLAIVDLTPAGDQPITNEDGRYVMVFNGEIYNHLELRAFCESKGHTFSSRMDGEVILHLWEMEGAQCLRRLNGIFAVAIADTETGELFLARDPMGVKPLVYATAADGSITFASEPSAVVQLGGADQTPSLEALACFLTFLWVPDPLTPFAAIRSLPSGHVLTWRAGQPTHLVRYRSMTPDVAAIERRTFDQAESELDEHLRAACQRQLLGDVPISIMASGGVDSSLIWEASRNGLAQAFTIEWGSAEGEGSHEDSDAVKVLERSLGTPVTYLNGRQAADRYLPLGGDLFADPAFELTRLIAQHTRAAGRKVLLSGQGGDELFGGYRRHMVAPLLGHVYTGALGRRLPAIVSRLPGGFQAEFASRLARATSHRDPFRRYMELCTYSTAAERAAVLGCSEREVADDVVLRRHRDCWDSLPTGLSFLRKAMTLDLQVYMPGLGLSYVDRAGMEHGVEIRVPFLDLELVDWSFTLEDHHLVRRMSGKLLPKSLARKTMPREVIDRPKRGFGAPSSTLATNGRAAGERGHRQGRYFNLAAGIVDRWQAEHATPERV